MSKNFSNSGSLMPSRSREARQRANRRKEERRRERYRTDPVFREKMRAKSRRKQKRRRLQRQALPPLPKFCISCGTDISHRPRQTKFCSRCIIETQQMRRAISEARRQQREQEREVRRQQREWTRQARSYNPWPCATCGCPLGYDRKRRNYCSTECCTIGRNARERKRKRKLSVTQEAAVRAVHILIDQPTPRRAIELRTIELTRRIGELETRGRTRQEIAHELGISCSRISELVRRTRPKVKIINDSCMRVRGKSNRNRVLSKPWDGSTRKGAGRYPWQGPDIELPEPTTPEEKAKRPWQRRREVRAKLLNANAITPLRSGVRACGYCGVLFMAMNGHVRYCSLECRNGQHNARIRESRAVAVRICTNCGDEFLPSRGQRYCSPDCKRDQLIARKRTSRYRALKRERKRKRRILVKACQRFIQHLTD